MNQTNDGCSIDVPLSQTPLLNTATCFKCHFGGYVGEIMLVNYGAKLPFIIKDNHPQLGGLPKEQELLRQ